MEMNIVDPHLSTTPVLKGRKAPPSHYTFKINSFSLLSKASIEKCISQKFEAGGYQWCLTIYPSGNPERDGLGHISIYLDLMDPTSLPVDWEVNAIINFSAYNFFADEYAITQETKVRRFHVLKTKWGVSKFIDLLTFKDPSNGYLVDDTCVFGVEVFVVKTLNKGDCLWVDGPITVHHNWKINKFSSTTLETYQSESFVGGDYKWKLLLCPNGTGVTKGKYMSLFLDLDVSTLLPNTKLVVDGTLRVTDQIGGRHVELKFYHKFSSSNSWGSRKLVALPKFKDPNNGFLVNDTCFLEAEFTIIGRITSQNE